MPVRWGACGGPQEHASPSIRAAPTRILLSLTAASSNSGSLSSFARMTHDRMAPALPARRSNPSQSWRIRVSLRSNRLLDRTNSGRASLFPTWAAASATPHAPVYIPMSSEDSAARTDCATAPAAVRSKCSSPVATYNSARKRPTPPVPE